jgi:diguanylate cyclase (GGDEF)-like protein
VNWSFSVFAETARTALDVPTLFVVATCVTVLLGVVLLFAWVQDRSIRALAWWSSAYLIGGSSIALWSMQGSAALPAVIPSALMFTACGMVWNGARLFHGRRILPLGAVAGAIAWLTACQIASFADASEARIILSSLIISAYTFLIAFEFWRERRKTLASRWAAVIVPMLHGAIFLFPIPLAALGPELGSALFTTGWFALFTLATLLYAVGTALLVLFLNKDRAEQVHKTAARTDPLTGLFNRRAFFECAEQMLAAGARKQRPATVLMFDLDHFKKINDRFGHAIGDDALRTFAKTIASTMRAGDVIARLGGEEFAAIIPGTLADGKAAAERVRAAFEAAGREISGHAVGATVSIGAACSATARTDINALLGAADAALYRAKSNGRNRVEAVEHDPLHPAPPAAEIVVLGVRPAAPEAATAAAAAYKRAS